MKILIGTPIYEPKDYAIKRWLTSVSQIELNPDDTIRLLMVDNSENDKWQDKVREYCRELNFTNYDLVHLSGMKDGQDYEDERLFASRQVIEDTLLNEGYDYFWSWECDILCPPGILKYMLKLTDDFEAIYHTYLPREMTDFQEQDGVGCVLFNRKVFETFRSALDKLAIESEIVKNGWRVVEIHNLFKLEHLA
jgi:hypothetical protein